MKKLRWGILATGYIAGRFASGLKTCRSGELAAVSSRSLESAKAFAAERGASRAFGSHEELLGQPNIDAVYIATPHPFHAELAIKAAQAGKHILCEKPIAMNLRQTQAVVEAAEKAKVTLMEAFMYRCHPQTAKLVELVTSGALGKVALVQAAFSFHAPFDAEGRLFSKRLGGGGILDVGGYPSSFACMIADAASGQSLVPGEVLGALGQLHPETGADTLALANLRFANGVCAQVSCGTQLTQDNVARVYGSKAWVHVEQPWVVNRDGGDWSFTLHREDTEPERVSGRDERSIYGIEADTFAALVYGEALDAPGISIMDTQRVMGLLDQWREQIGLRYEADRD